MSLQPSTKMSLQPSTKNDRDMAVLTAFTKLHLAELKPTTGRARRRVDGHQCRYPTLYPH